MSEFKFILGEVVSLPGIDMTGRVSSRQEFIGKQNEYHVHYLLPNLQVAHAVIGEAELVEAQPKKEDGLTVAVKVDETGLDSALTKARELKSIVRSVAFKTKPKTKSKSKHNR